MRTLLLLGGVVYLAGIPFGALIAACYGQGAAPGDRPSWRSIAVSALLWPRYLRRC